MIYENNFESANEETNENFDFFSDFFRFFFISVFDLAMYVLGLAVTCSGISPFTFAMHHGVD